MEHAIPEGSLTYTRQGQGLEITQYHGLAGQVVIPEKLPWHAETNLYGSFFLRRTQYTW